MDLKAAYSEFYAECREAAGKLKAGERLVEFPEGCFPPGLPFVEPASALAGEHLSAVLGAPAEIPAPPLVKQGIPLPGRPEEVPHGGASTLPPSSPIPPLTDTAPLAAPVPPSRSAEPRSESIATEDTVSGCAAAGSDRRPRPP